jgi:hypothetical protein
MEAHRTTSKLAAMIVADSSRASTNVAVPPGLQQIPEAAMTQLLSQDVLSHVLTFLGPYDVRTVASVSQGMRALALPRFHDAKAAMDALCVSPQQAIDALIQTQLLHPSAEALSGFVHTLELHETSPRVLCNILTPRRFEGIMSSEAAWKAAKPACLHYIRNHFDFSGLSVLDAMRALVRRIKLPSSTRSVSFLFRMASKHYWETLQASQVAASSWFTTHDSVYLLFYGVFILNNDVHSRVLKAAHKMTRERFIANHRATPGLETVPAAYLGSLYDEVKAHPLPVSGNAAPSQPSTLDFVKQAASDGLAFLSRLFA